MVTHCDFGEEGECKSRPSCYEPANKARKNRASPSQQEAAGGKEISYTTHHIDTREEDGNTLERGDKEKKEQARSNEKLQERARNGKKQREITRKEQEHEQEHEQEQGQEQEQEQEQGQEQEQEQEQGQEQEQEQEYEEGKTNGIR